MQQDCGTGIWMQPKLGSKLENLVPKRVLFPNNSNNIVLCEAIWTLESAFKYKKQAIMSFLELILQADFFDFEDRETIQSSLNDYRDSRADFSDCLIGRRNQSLGCTETASFDRGARDLSNFSIL
jgi:predicted nucleic-acid-binding protein